MGPFTTFIRLRHFSVTLFIEILFSLIMATNIVVSAVPLNNESASSLEKTFNTIETI